MSSSSSSAVSFHDLVGDIGVIGGGNMVKAILLPLFEKGVLDPKTVTICAKTEATIAFWQNLGCHVVDETMIGDVVLVSTTVIWAVKPQVFPMVVGRLKPDAVSSSKRPQLHVSVMAGISLNEVKQAVLRGLEIPAQLVGFIRVMANIALRVSSGVAVYACDANVKEAVKQVINAIFSPIGLCYEVQESQIDAYCGLFGSGIGFMFPIMEALSDGAVKMGIPRAISLEIAAQVLKGAGELYLKDKTHPGALKDMVCSPGGTTIAGISELERSGVRSGIISAVEAATIRGRELGEMAAANSRNKNL